MRPWQELAEYYVYDLIDPRDDTVFYVGKGKGSRINHHEREARAGRVSRKCERIRAIEAEGLRVKKHRVRTFKDEQEAYDFEAERINGFGLSNLTNIIPGGGGAHGRATLTEDRLTVRLACYFLQMTRGWKYNLLINGKPVFTDEDRDKNRKCITEILMRRGQDWVNAISKRHNIEFREVVANG